MRIRALHNREFELTLSDSDEHVEVYTNSGNWQKLTGVCVVPEFAKLRVNGGCVIELPGESTPLTRAKVAQASWGSYWEGPERAALTQLELLAPDRARSVDVKILDRDGSESIVSVLTNYRVSNKLLAFMADSIAKAFTESGIKAEDVKRAFTGILVVPDGELGAETMLDGTRRKVLSLGTDPGGTLIVTNSVARNSKALAETLLLVLDRVTQYEVGTGQISERGMPRSTSLNPNIRPALNVFEREIAPHGVVVTDKPRPIFGTNMAEVNGTVYVDHLAGSSILVDDKLTPELRDIYKEFLHSLSDIRHESPGTLRKILEAVTTFVNQKMVRGSDRDRDDGESESQTKTLMDFVGKGEAKEIHRALLSCYLIGRLVRRGVLQGRLSLEQNQDGAAWIRYVSGAGEVYIQDPDQAFVASISELSQGRFGYLRREDLVRYLAHPISV